MIGRSAILVLLLSGCGAPALTIANHVGLVVQSTAIACDWGQTRRASEMGWRVGGKQLVENNLVLGETPGPAAVDVYFLVAIGAAAFAWHVLPRRWRMLAPLTVGLLQADSIAHNLGREGVDLGVCGLGAARLTADHR